MGPTEFRFIAIFFIVIMGMVVIPVVVAMLLHRKYGNKLPGKVAVVFVIGIICYFTAFFNYAPHMIPEAWRLVPHEVYQCEWKTIYVEKK